jgi:hypothetical protein
MDRMGITIAGISNLGDASGAASSAPISTALQAQVESGQTADVEALLGSLGLGANTNTTA